MQSTARHILKETLWLALIGLITFIIGQVIFALALSNSALDIHLHDTYFVIANTVFIFPLFVTSVFIIYTFRTFRNKFEKPFLNWTMLTSGIILILGLTIATKYLFQFSCTGDTLYPPLSQLGQDKLLEMKPNSVLTFLSNISVYIQGIVLLIMLFFCYKWGHKKN